MTRDYSQSTDSHPSGNASIIDVAARVASIRNMKHGPLKELYRHHFGEIPLTHNLRHLRRKLAAKIQLDAIPKAEQERLEALVPKALEQLRLRVERRRKRVAKVPMAVEQGSIEYALLSGTGRPSSSTTIQRDPRLPRPGTVITKKYKATTHHITVNLEDFEWNGKRWNSLSRIAFEITGTRWNGLLFFGLVDRRKAKESTQQTKEHSHV